MSIWLKTLLLFVVFNEVQLYRQLNNSTCMELAKPSNHQFRLACNDTPYHCLLDEKFTKEYEICKMWIWIPEEKCAYLNTYQGNIDARSCLSSAQMDCPKKQYRSVDNIIYAACYVKKNPIINRPTARNTSCLELTRPSNKVFRLSCNDASTYHCLLDENYTQEYEVCMMWKWIPEGKCAYFNTNSGGNIDVRNCTSSPQFVCPKKRYRSEDIMQYDACFVTNSQSSITQTPSLNGNGGNATISLMQKTSVIWNVLPIIMGIIVPFVTIAVLCFTFMHLKHVRPYKKGTDIRSLNDDKNVEQQPFLKSEMEKTLEHSSTVKQNNEYRLNEERKKDWNKDDEEESSNVFDDTLESLQSNKEPKDEQYMKWCLVVYTLLTEDGWKLSQEVMASVFTTLTGNSLKELLKDESVRENVKRVLPTESHFLLANNLNREKSIHVVYGLLQIYLDKKYHPKSGWGNPVREKDIGIGDDIDRLFRIVAITRDISNPSLEFIPKEGYIRLLDIMIDALTRLGPSVISKKDFNAFADKMRAIENQIFIQPVIKKIENFIKYGDI